MFGKRQTEQGVSHGSAGRRVPLPKRSARWSLALLAAVGSAFVATAAAAQQAFNPGFDPKQFERKFDAQQTEQQMRTSRSLPGVPRVDQSAGPADSRKQIDLRA